MRRSVTKKDISTFAHLDMIYNHIRVLEAQQNTTKFKCLGSGECCKIGLVIPMAECAHIAFRLNKEYYLKLEDLGENAANEWLNSVIQSLKEAMFDEDWQEGGETTRHCAFYKGGCTIYGFRPMVCRTFGTITNVDNYCPRIRNAENGIDFYGGEPVQAIIKEYQSLLKEYASDKDHNYDMTVYMATGVLSFMLPIEELQELHEKTPEKFWKGVKGWYNYRVEFTRLHGYDYNHLLACSEEDGIPLVFPDSAPLSFNESEG
jgi:Fe-S-cluster containining protein